jgi:gamma-glutamylcysteine synthetase
MQDQIEELEYIKNNIDCGSSSSLVLNGTDENGMDPSVANRGTNYDEMRRKSVLFLHEAQRLANERRASQLRQTTMDASISNHLEKISDSSENDDHNSFNFDQRSEETIDTANLNDLNEISPTS